MHVDRHAMVAVVPGHYLADYINFGDRFGPDLATGSGALSLRSNSSSFRGGHAYAEGAALHGAPPEHHNFKESRKAVTCGLVLPGLAIGAAPFTGGLSSGLLLLYPLNLSRISWRLSREGGSALGRLPPSSCSRSSRSPRLAPLPRGPPHWQPLEAHQYKAV